MSASFSEKTFAIKKEASEKTTVIVQHHTGFLRHFIQYPSSPSRLGWDLFGALLIFYDLVTIPLQVFQPPETGFSKGMDWLTLVFWTVNCFMSLFVGYVEDGITVMVPKKILGQY